LFCCATCSEKRKLAARNRPLPPSLSPPPLASLIPPSAIYPLSMDVPYWHRTPPLARHAKHLPLSASSSSDLLLSQASGTGDKENNAWQQGRTHEFAPVEIATRSGEVLGGGMLTVLGQGLAAWKGRMQKTILGPGRDNATEVVVRFDYQGVRLFQVER